MDTPCAKRMRFEARSEYRAHQTQQAHQAHQGTPGTPRIPGTPTTPGRTGMFGSVHGITDLFIGDGNLRRPGIGLMGYSQGHAAALRLLEINLESGLEIEVSKVFEVVSMRTGKDLEINLVDVFSSRRWEVAVQFLPEGSLCALHIVLRLNLRQWTFGDNFGFCLGIPDVFT
ncbi:hypothetical protein K432DRAFT_472196 [Lepidopterella palustris CBS 459.81]|uniref:Uncharacterized protein n=1 Tax=Lepidopterella palustris CBS 459.81 TaxID=1314670 RepID=A0A8E2DYG9_9PEZI|nr:hypothetical protein K432DRAFT_472196 [Lepidopterella palustris CBS 459.81]